VTREEWNEVEALAASVLDLEGAERQVFLQERCGQDSRLLEKVQRLLAAAQEAGAFLEQPEWAPWKGFPVEDSTDTQEPDLAGACFGAYRIERLLGRGGMGAVNLPHRNDRTFDKKVALKVVKPGRSSSSSKGL